MPSQVTGAYSLSDSLIRKGPTGGTNERAQVSFRDIWLTQIFALSVACFHSRALPFLSPSLLRKPVYSFQNWPNTSCTHLPWLIVLHGTQITKKDGLNRPVELHWSSAQFIWYWPQLYGEGIGQHRNRFYKVRVPVREISYNIRRDFARKWKKQINRGINICKQHALTRTVWL